MMERVSTDGEAYRTPTLQVGRGAAAFPSLAFYWRLVGIVLRSNAIAKRGEYGDEQWQSSSLEVFRALEAVGVRFEITGLRHLSGLREPCVIIGNHMSTMETLVLPALVRPYLEVTFIVKASLLHYPFFRYVMRSRNPVAVGRTNPRQDLKTVLVEGAERLGRGISLIVFPQTTRASRFDPREFNSIGVKLAQRAGVPILPLALRTDAWPNSKYFKEFGRIDLSKEARLAFGEPLRVEGRGARENQAVIDFIKAKLREWGE